MLAKMGRLVDRASGIPLHDQPVKVFIEKSLNSLGQAADNLNFQELDFL
jgi:hypothetical protein